MINKAAIVLLASVSALIVIGCASVPKANLQADYPEEKARIEQRLNQIFDAAQKKELDRLDSYHFYGPKFTKFSASFPGRQDAAIARKGERDGLAAINGLKMQAEDLKIDVFGNVAIVTFILNTKFNAGAGEIRKDD